MCVCVFFLFLFLFVLFCFVFLVKLSYVIDERGSVENVITAYEESQ